MYVFKAYALYVFMNVNQLLNEAGINLVYSFNGDLDLPCKGIRPYVDAKSTSLAK